MNAGKEHYLELNQTTLPQKNTAKRSFSDVKCPHVFVGKLRSKGQGVSSVYTGTDTKLLENTILSSWRSRSMSLGPADIKYYHTIDVKFFFLTLSKRRGKSGLRPLLPETLEGSL